MPSSAVNPIRPDGSAAGNAQHVRGARPGCARAPPGPTFTPASLPAAAVTSPLSSSMAARTAFASRSATMPRNTPPDRTAAAFPGRLRPPRACPAPAAAPGRPWPRTPRHGRSWPAPLRRRSGTGPARPAPRRRPFLLGRRQPGRQVDQLKAVVQVLLKLTAQSGERHLHHRLAVRRILARFGGRAVDVGKVWRAGPAARVEDPAQARDQVAAAGPWLAHHDGMPGLAGSPARCNRGTGAGAPAQHASRPSFPGLPQEGRNGRLAARRRAVEFKRSATATTKAGGRRQPMTRAQSALGFLGPQLLHT